METTDARKRREERENPKPHWDPAVCELIEKAYEQGKKDAALSFLRAALTASQAASEVCE